MAEIKRSTLFGKLNPLGYKSIEAATIFCKMRGNPYVEVVHWLHQLLQQQDSDVLRIIKHFSLDASRLAADLVAALDRLPRGATAISDFSPHIETALQQAYVYATLLYGEYQVRTGHLIVAFLKTDSLRNVFLGLSREFTRIKAEQLSDDFARIVAGSPEDGMRASDGSGLAAGASPGETSGAIPPAEMGKQEALKRFTTDLTEKARKGEIDPIVGRDEEIRQCVDILMRRRQNNPILTGEAGVGKTAVVEGFVHRILAGDVPPALKDVSIRALDVGLLQAGASMKGEFEQRLRGVIDEIQASPKPIILFIDEAHTLMGAGGSGASDAANLLKPALARGTLRTIAATTWDEYKRHIEKDPALTRRFQVVKVDEPDEPKCIRMMRAVMVPFEKHHKRPGPGRGHRGRRSSCPTATSPAASCPTRPSASLTPPPPASPSASTPCRRRWMIAAAASRPWKPEQGILGRETATGLDHQARVAEIDDRAWQRKRKSWPAWKSTGTKRRNSSPKSSTCAPNSAPAASAPMTPSRVERASRPLMLPSLPPAPSPSTLNPQPSTSDPPSLNGQLTPEERDKLLAELKDFQAKLKQFQGETPLIFPSVDANAIASVVADWTGIPVGPHGQERNRAGAQASPTSSNAASSASAMRSR